MVSSSFAKMATVSASTTRKNAGSTGQEANLAGLVCLPVMPASLDLLEAVGIHSARKKFETYITKQIHTDNGVSVDQVPDIGLGDHMVIASIEYTVTYVAEWDDGVNDYLRVLLDFVKGSV